MNPSSENPYKGMEPTAFAPQYQGLLANPHQRSSLTYHGILANRSRFTDAAHGGLHTIMSPVAGQSNSQEFTPQAERNFSTSNVSSETTFYKSCISSDIEMHPSSGVCLNDSSKGLPSTSQHQTKTFRELAAEKGIMEWNHGVFDERWKEIFPSNPTPEVKAHHSASTQELGARATEIATLHHQKMESFLKELDDTERRMDSGSGTYRPDPSIWGVENSYSQYPQALRGQRPTIKEY